MRRIAISISLFLSYSIAFPQANPSLFPNNVAKTILHSDSIKSRTTATKQSRSRMIISPDTLTMSDYTLSIERVNDNLNEIGDSAKLGFEVVQISRRISEMSLDVAQIRQNVRGRNAIFNIKNQYLYQSFASRLDIETDQIKNNLDEMYHRVSHEKMHLRKALADSIFQKLYSDKELRTTFNLKLVQLERKWNRIDSLTKANVDTLNALKVRESDNSYYLSNMLYVIENRMDKAVPKLFGNEESYLWQTNIPDPSRQEITKNQISLFTSEKNAISYYINQTSGERKIFYLIGILLFTWIIFKRKLLKTYREKPGAFGDLNLKYLVSNPLLSVFIFLFCLMPFFDAYAPESYISLFYFLLLIGSCIFIFRFNSRSYFINWLFLNILFVADSIAYLFIEPTFNERVLLLIVHVCIGLFSWRFYKSLQKKEYYFKLLKVATLTAIFLSVISVLLNIFGRFSLAGIVGLSAIFAVTQAVILTIFIEIIIEGILLQLQSRRMHRSSGYLFNTNGVIQKIKVPLILVAVLLWMIMLTSNLNIYHTLYAIISESLTITRTIGSVSFQLLSVLLFFIIIWMAHLLQRMISFFFGETGNENEDSGMITKSQHSRLLITRLMVLIGGYMLAIAASGLPIDKLTFLLGALGIGIGMGLQNIVNNFVSGIILIFDGSLQIGDEIEVSGQAGKVKEIGLRTSTLSTSDGADVIIPNGTILSQNIVNWTFSNNEKRIMLSFMLSGKELDANMINEVINTTITNLPDIIEKKKPVILYTGVTPYNCKLTIRFWSTVQNVDQIKSEAMLQLSASFKEKKIGFN